MLRLLLGSLLIAAGAAAQVKLGSVTLQASVRTRYESWDWFSNGQGDGTYGYLGSIGRLGISQARAKYDWQLEFAAPVLLGLPEDATATGAAGALGLGSNYYNANHRQRNAAGLFLKQGNVRWKATEQQSLKVGRFEFNDGTEVVSKDATLAALKRDRIAQRLIGNFGWTHAQRSLDGFHYIATGKVHVHAVGALPTRGVFQTDGWGPLRTGVAYISVNRAQGPSDWRVFGIYYQDAREVMKTDNRPLALRQGDFGRIKIGTYGGHYLRHTGPLDLLVWGAAQSGNWGRLAHAATAIALEAGWQPAIAKRVKPWLRAGFFNGSGDGKATDGRHGTFFQLLPTPRPFARFPFFNLMNNQDMHGSLTLRPAKTVTVRTEVHGLRLASGADQWLLGGGAFQPWSFGYIGRPSPVTGGRPGLANLYDISLDWAASAHHALALYYGHAQGLRVVEAIYPKSPHGNFAYLEWTLKF